MEYVIVQVDVTKDGQKIVDFWTNNFPEWPKEKYHWFYKSNPSGKARCWLVNTKSQNDIIGTVALFPRIMYINNVKKHPCIIGDLIFKKAHRNFWPALVLQKEVQTSVKGGLIDFIYGSPNKQADRLLKRSGYEIIGTSITYRKPLRTFRHLNSRLNNVFLSRVFSRIIDSVLFILSKETCGTSLRNMDVSAQLCTGFDSRFDRLWERAVGNYSIIGERNSEFLNWRFVQCPYIEYKIFALASKKSDEVHGYIVYKADDKDLTIADLFLEDIGKYGDALLSLFLRHARGLGVESVVFSFLGPDKLRKKLRGFRFLKTSDCRSFVVYSNTSSNKEDYLFDSDSWYFMECDNDI
jgi:hypothetical protein